MKVGTISIAFACLLTVGCGKPSVKNLDSEIAELKSEIRKQGWPAEPGDLRPMLKVNPDQNAAPAYKLLVLKMIDPRERKGEYIFLSPWKPEINASFKECGSLSRHLNNFSTPPDLAQIKLQLKTLDPYLDEFVESMQLPGWDFECKWEEGAAMLLTDLSKTKELSNALSIRAYVRAMNGQTDLAIKDLDAIRKMANHMRTDPGVIQMLVGSTMETIVVRASVALLRARPSDKALIEKLETLLRTPSKSPNFKLMWSTDVMQYTSLLDNLWSDEGLRKIGLRDGEEKPIPERLAKETQAKLFRLYKESIQKWPLSFDDMDQAISVLEPISKEMFEVASSSSNVIRMLGSETDSPYCEALRSYRKQETRRRLAAVACAIVSQGKTSSGYALPKMALEKELYDPFSGKPFILVQTVNGFALYSVGSNKKDDGGSAQEDTNGESLDIVFDFPIRFGSGL